MKHSNINTKYITLISLFIIYFLFSASTSIFTNNYVQYAKSPNKKFELIAIPESDANETDGEIHIWSVKEKKIIHTFTIGGFDESVFVLSNDGNILYQIKDVQIGHWAPTEPDKHSKVFVHKNVGPTDTILLNYEFSHRPYFTRKKGFEYRFKKKRIKLAYESISYKNDTLRISAALNNYYINLNTGEILGLDIKDQGLYQNHTCKLVYKDVFERRRLMRKLSQL